MTTPSTIRANTTRTSAFSSTATATVQDCRRSTEIGRAHV